MNLKNKKYGEGAVNWADLERGEDEGGGTLYPASGGK
jgi:hypothetical protein